MSASPPIVLVHGAWHGAWCFAGLQHALDELGLPSYAIDLPGHGTSGEPFGTLHSDAAAVAAVRCTLDQSIHISHQDAMSQRCTTVHALHTDHSPFASAPALTAGILQGVVGS